MLLKQLKRNLQILHGIAFFSVCLSVILSGGICYGNESTQTLFLKKTFQDMVPKPDYIWITPTVRPIVEAILLREYKGPRIKYWRKNDLAAWIFEEPAKDSTVRVGIVVSQGKIQTLEILSAEGRWGSLVKSEKFTGQFKNVGSDESKRLTGSIDGISGATISVNTVSRLVQLALALHEIQRTESN